MKNITGNVDVARIEEAIHMLNSNVEQERIKSFVAILEAIKQDPGQESLLVQLRDAFQNLGITQGAVLTYASSIYDLIVDDPFGENEPDSDDN
ncbi:hypothetical protein DFR30_1075 [Thiogranum longum]|uniref:Uncharacterized protein n=1 Tax=Thiogranum longum TaxID=1537524 RepID=A0A4R1HC63_9GAMM|nr:hypothetical protein [Thiogranum longum]TCK17825.1 hypothetical protein DFR30_1075 [Thiogranum longum]